MSALSTPSGGGTTAQNKPTSGKQRYQKLDINSLYCANRNENSEPSSVKSQLSRKHGMQSLGKVPSARRPPANLPSLKTETGQDPNANSVSTVVTTVSPTSTCTTQTISTTPNSNVVAGAGPGGWVALPPPSSPHFRTEFPSLEAAAQPSHRTTEHTTQPQLRPQTEGSWTCGGTAGVRQENIPLATVAPTPATTPASQQTPASLPRSILPSFMKGSSGGGLGLGTGALGALRDSRSGGGAPGPRPPPRPPATPRAVEVLTARPILRDDQISSLDDISRDAGWAQQDDIDYDQKLDFSDGESSAPNKISARGASNRASVESERTEAKLQDLGDEDQLWAERRQKQTNEVAQAVARARILKEEEQRRQLRDVSAPHQQHAGHNAHAPHGSLTSKDTRERHERTDAERIDNRNRDNEVRDKDTGDNRDRADVRDRMDIRDKDRNDIRDREKERTDNRDRDRNDNRDRFDQRDRERDIRDRERGDRERDRDRIENRARVENRERSDNDKERIEHRDRDRNESRNRERYERERDRGDRDRERDRADRERNDRDRDRDRDFRDRDRDYGRDRDQTNPAFSKAFQANIPPRFLKQQQNRQQEDHNKSWGYSGKQAPRRQEPPYNAPRHAPHNGRRSYSRDYSDREDEFRREKDGPGPQWRSEMQDYERSGRELDRTNSKDSYDYKDRRNETDKKVAEPAIESGSRTAADKLSEVFERRSIGVAEPFMSPDSSSLSVPERRQSPPSNICQRESSERDFGKTSWAEVTQEEPIISTNQNIPLEKDTDIKEIIDIRDCENIPDDNKNSGQQSNLSQPIQQTPPLNVLSNSLVPQMQGPPKSQVNINLNVQSFVQNNQQVSQIPYGNIQQPTPGNQSQTTIPENQSTSISVSLQPTSKQLNQSEIQKPTPEQIIQQNAVNVKPTFISQKSEKDLSETESVASKSCIEPSILAGIKPQETCTIDSFHGAMVSQKRPTEDKKTEKVSNEQLNKIPAKEPIERKSSGSGSEKKSRGYSGGPGGSGNGGYAVYTRGWAPRRRSHRTSRSNNRASESDGSTDGAPNSDRKDRRRAPRSPRGPKIAHEKTEDPIRPSQLDPSGPINDGMENREPFAPRGQPSRRGRGGFQGTARPPAPAKRVTGYGPPNTKSPFSQANRAVKENVDNKDTQTADDKLKGNNKPRTGSSTGRGRDRRPKGPGGPISGEDENWETTSEHSEGGTSSRRRSLAGRRGGQSQKGQGGRNQNSGNRQNNGRNIQTTKKDGTENKTVDITEAITDLKVSSAKKDDEVVDDGFQEVRNKKNSKDTRSVLKEDSQNAAKQQTPRSHSNQGGGRNGSSSRNSNDKSNSRGSAPVSNKSGSQYDRPRQANLPPRFVKQRQKQQMGLVSTFGPDTGAAPPPPIVNAWDKPISQSLRANIEELETVENKSGQSSQRSTPGDIPTETKTAQPTCNMTSDKTGVLDGATPPVETIIFENTNYKAATPDEALQQKYQMSAPIVKNQGEDIKSEIDNRSLSFNGEVRQRPRSIQDIISESTVTDGDTSNLGLPISFDTSQKAEDSSDMKLDFAFDSDLGQLTEDKSAKSLGLPRGVHMSTSSTISPLAADLNLKIASVKKVWEMSTVAEGSEEIQFTGFEENNTETAPPNVCKVKPTQQLQSPPPQHYNHVGYQSGYGGLSVPSPPAVMFNSSQQLLGSSQQLQQQGGLYGAFLDQSRGQFGGFPGTPYGAGSATPYNYQPPPDMFQSLPNQYRMAAAAGGGAAFGQSGQLGNSPSTVLISSTSNSLMSATVKPSTQQIGAIGSKGGSVGGVGGVGGVSTYQQQYLGYSAPVGEAPYSLPGLLPRPAPPANSYYSPYQPPTAPAPTYPLQFTQPAQSGAFGSQFLSSQLQVAAAVQQMQQQYRAPLQQQYGPPQPRPPPQQLKSPLHEHANGFAPLCEAASPTPKGAAKPQKPPHSPPHHKYHAPPPHTPHPPPAHTPHQHHQQQQMVSGGNNGRCGGGGGVGNGGGGMSRGGMGAPRYPAPIGQRPHAPALPMYRAPPGPAPAPAPRTHHAAHHQPRPNLYYHQHQRNGGGGGERVPDGADTPGGVDDTSDMGAPVGGEVTAPTHADIKPE